jgi:hypothetical protein
LPPVSSTTAFRPGKELLDKLVDDQRPLILLALEAAHGQDVLIMALLAGCGVHKISGTTSDGMFEVVPGLVELGE